MRVYIAGPMRGAPDRNYPLFEAAEDLLRLRGHVPINPAVRARDRFKVATDADLTEAVLRDALVADLYDLLACDGVLLLPGWEASEGACLEEHVARLTGKRRMFYRIDNNGLIWIEPAS